MRLATPMHKALDNQLRGPLSAHLELWYLDLPTLRGGFVTLVRLVVEVIR